MDTVANCPFSNQMHKTSPDNWKVLEHDKMKLQLCMKPGKYQTQLASNRNLNAATKNKNRTTKLQHNGSTKQFSFKIYVQYIVESWKLKVESWKHTVLVPKLTKNAPKPIFNIVIIHNQYATSINGALNIWNKKNSSGLHTSIAPAHHGLELRTNQNSFSNGSSCLWEAYSSMADLRSKSMNCIV